MEKVNETIALAKNEGLAVDISRIQWDTDGEEVAGLNPWMECHFPADEIAKALGKTADENGVIFFTEDEFEEFLSNWLTNTSKFCHKGFRWLWDKYRNFKAA